MKHFSILVFVASFCIALVYLSLQSEAGQAWLSSWQDSPQPLQTHSVDTLALKRTEHLQEQVHTLSVKLEEQAEAMRAMQTLISQLRQQTDFLTEKTDVLTPQSTVEPKMSVARQNKQVSTELKVASEIASDTGNAQNIKREQLARLQDVVSKMEMASLRALSN
ncbi:MAG: hypothetical protein ABNH21_15745 [Glaciecola sp.]|jgi:GTPase involved in cell partitioning and DNA repair